MSIKVCGWRVLIKSPKVEEVDPTFKRAKAAGIALPETDEMRRENGAVSEGVVVSIGDYCWDGKDPWCKVGDKIIHSKWAGKKVKDPENNEVYTLLNDQDILCVISGGAE